MLALAECAAMIPPLSTSPAPHNSTASAASSSSSAATTSTTTPTTTTPTPPTPDLSSDEDMMAVIIDGPSAAPTTTTTSITATMTSSVRHHQSHHHPNSPESLLVHDQADDDVDPEIEDCLVALSKLSHSSSPPKVNMDSPLLAYSGLRQLVVLAAEAIPIPVNGKSSTHAAASSSSHRHSTGKEASGHHTHHHHHNKSGGKESNGNGRKQKACPKSVPSKPSSHHMSADIPDFELDEEDDLVTATAPGITPPTTTTNTTTATESPHLGPSGLLKGCISSTSPGDARKRRYEWLSPYSYVKDPEARAKIAQLESRLAEEMHRRTLIEEEARSKQLPSPPNLLSTSVPERIPITPRKLLLTPEERRLEMQMNMTQRLVAAATSHPQPQQPQQQFIQQQQQQQPPSPLSTASIAVPSAAIPIDAGCLSGDDCGGVGSAPSGAVDKKKRNYRRYNKKPFGVSQSQQQSGVTSSATAFGSAENSPLMSPSTEPTVAMTTVTTTPIATATTNTTSALHQALMHQAMASSEPAVVTGRTHRISSLPPPPMLNGFSPLLMLRGIGSPQQQQQAQQQQSLFATNPIAAASAAAAVAAANYKRQHAPQFFPSAAVPVPLTSPPKAPFASSPLVPLSTTVLFPRNAMPTHI